ncbi:MAG: hypothetical protein A2Z34_07005 [Planctomycetes bacterium RBG_16_59_8]|nr:MAG: hypothetical protein A2Z34_07005 [Planctomycetes bacterium RBG_16_59_8]
MPAVEPEGFTMTPMIDIVFQLIIFFMLVSSMNTVRFTPLELPIASRSEEDRQPSPETMVINVRADGLCLIGGKAYSPEGVRALFREARQRNPDPADARGVTYPLHVRADAGVDYGHVQQILTFASVNGGIRKLQIGAIKDSGK